jgi:hypothetical protein
LFVVEFHLPKSQKEKNCYYSFAKIFLARFLCALLQISFKRKKNTRREEKKKNNFIISAACVRGKKVQRTISRLFKYEKNRIIQIYVLQYVFVAVVVVVRAASRRESVILTHTPIANIFFFTHSFLFSYLSLRHPANVFLDTDGEKLRQKSKHAEAETGSRTTSV